MKKKKCSVLIVDEYIVKRITETLREGETGIVFIGASHNVVYMLPEDIEAIEVKKKEEMERYKKELQKWRLKRA